MCMTSSIGFHDVAYLDKCNTQTTRSGETALMAASKGGHTDVLKLLMPVSGQEALNACTRAGMTALMMACRYDRVGDVCVPPTFVAAFLLGSALFTDMDQDRN